MNRIDSRFLNFSTTVNETRNDAPYQYNINAVGIQYIVGSNPTGVFEGVAPNSLARYDGGRWIFTPPARDLPHFFDLSRSDLVYYDGNNNAWMPVGASSAANNATRTFGDMLVRYVWGAIRDGDSLPSTCEQGEWFLNLSDKKFYYAAGINEWEDRGEAATGLHLIAKDGNPPCLYQCDGVSIHPESSGYTPCLYIVDAGTVVNYSIIEDDAHNVLLYHYDANKYVQIYPVDTASVASEVISSMNKTYTETHVLTSEDVSAKAFTLTYSVVSGEESNTLCFVQGLLQPIGTAFTVSGSTLRWDGKTLDGNVNAGDVFIVQYTKSAD